MTPRGPARTAPRTPLLALAATCVLLGVSLIDAPYPHDQRLQHIPTVIALGLLAAAAVGRRISSLAFYGLLGFLVLHVVGARWVYSAVPYDDWTDAAFGVRLSESFGWKRNHYDRFVHLAFGGLAMPAAAELVRRWTGGSSAVGVTLGLCLVGAASAVYEVAEWQIAVWMSSDRAEAYNGQQGDLWDAQKDMALALLGAALVAAPLLAVSPSPPRESAA